ncbi:hypothetical protein FACS1894217_06630 [Clostridia bacterium]|nr:hypothetical protein FACS1894217_06630 [Clostridia bacterium]
MQLELERRAIQSFDRLYSASTIKDETADIIVPDSYPDILRIIDARGLICLKEKRCTDSGVELIGAVHVSVLYAPDSAEEHAAPRRLSVVVPYQHLFERKGLPTEARVLSDVILTDANARTINPRKLQVSTTFSLSVKCYAHAEHYVCSGVKASADTGLETLTKTVEVHAPVSVSDKVFALTDQVELPSGRPMIDEILHADVRLVARETKNVGTKAVLKAAAILNLLYTSEMGEIASWEQEVPFSQIIELGEPTDDELSLYTSLTLGGIDLGLEAPARVVDVELTVGTQIIGVAATKVNLLADAYSTKYHVLPEHREIGLLSISDGFSVRVPVREAHQLNPAPHSILDCGVSLATVESGAVLTTRAHVKLLYIADDGEYASASFGIPVEAENDAGDTQNQDVSAAISGDVFSGLSSDGLELRFTVLFEGYKADTRYLTVIDDVKADWEDPLEHNGASVTLRRVRDGERLWDIAKGYGTSIGDIAAANALTDGADLTAGTMLLIPRSR